MDKIQAQLINSQNQQVLVDVYATHLTFHNQELKSELQVNGIRLPVSLARDLGNQRVFDYNDPQFVKAFKMYYNHRQLDSIKLVWKTNMGPNHVDPTDPSFTSASKPSLFDRV